MSHPLYGWTGKVLHIDLSTRQSEALHPARSLYEKHLGGRGLAGYYLHPHCTREITDPALPILIFTGPLTGTDAPTSGRATIMSRSPLTGGLGVSSVGGGLGTRLKRAGWDGLIITGASATPCSIEIVDNEVRVTDTELWGATCGEVFDRLGDGPSVAVIGPAAENGTPLASIAVDRHHGAMRGGLGLVWATKKLKYIAIKGTGAVRIHDATALAEAREMILRLTAASPVLQGGHGLANRGTGAFFDLMDSRRIMPTDNFQRTRFKGAPRCNVAAYEAAFSPQAHGCEGCHIRCKRVTQDGHSVPEYDVMAHFTALIGNTDIKLVIQANTLCGQLGLDPISTASTLACRREITGEDFTPETLLSFIREMAEGGDAGQGSTAMAEAGGRPELSMSAKGLDLPSLDPRGAYGTALSYAVSTRGGCHGQAGAIGHEILRKPVATDRFTFSGKARIIKIGEDQMAAADSLAACRFIFFAAGLEEYARAFTAVTGLPASGGSLQAKGERIQYNERIMNHLNGFDARDDDLPPRFFTEPGTSGGGVDIPPLDRNDFLEARANYYKIRGLDDDGTPMQATIEKLGLVRKEDA